jgi:hypothetical protein
VNSCSVDKGYREVSLYSQERKPAEHRSCHFDLDITLARTTVQEWPGKRRAVMRQAALIEIKTPSGRGLTSVSVCCFSLVNQINRTLRLIVLITESICPLNTCLARLRVKPSATWKGICDGRDSA